MSSFGAAWTEGLSLALAAALDEFRGCLTDQIELLAIDCHPWHGTLDLALLTRSEVKQDPSLSASAEMAAWKHFRFSSAVASWQPALELARQMRDHYSSSADERNDVSNGYLHACAAALATSAVQESVLKYVLSEDFRISVPHPDTDEEFYPPA